MRVENWEFDPQSCTPYKVKLKYENENEHWDICNLYEKIDNLHRGKKMEDQIYTLYKLTVVAKYHWLSQKAL